jgi:hypothetical protein
MKSLWKLSLDDATGFSQFYQPEYLSHWVIDKAVYCAAIYRRQHSQGVGRENLGGLLTLPDFPATR